MYSADYKLLCVCCTKLPLPLWGRESGTETKALPSYTSHQVCVVAVEHVLFKAAAMFAQLTRQFGMEGASFD